MESEEKILIFWEIHFFFLCFFLFFFFFCKELAENFNFTPLSVSVNTKLPAEPADLAQQKEWQHRETVNLTLPKGNKLPTTCNVHYKLNVKSHLLNWYENLIVITISASNATLFYVSFFYCVWIYLVFCLCF